MPILPKGINYLIENISQVLEINPKYSKKLKKVVTAWEAEYLSEEEMMEENMSAQLRDEQNQGQTRDARLRDQSNYSSSNSFNHPIGGNGGDQIQRASSLVENNEAEQSMN